MPPASPPNAKTAPPWFSSAVSVAGTGKAVSLDQGSGLAIPAGRGGSSQFVSPVGVGAGADALVTGAVVTGGVVIGGATLPEPVSVVPW